MSILPRAMFFVFLFFIDLFSVTLSGLFAFWIRNNILFYLPHIDFSGKEILMFFAGVLVIIFSFIYTGLYVKRLPFWEESREIFVANLLGFLIILALIALMKFSHISRFFVLIWCLVNILIVPIVRYWGKRLAILLGLYRDNLLIIGVNDISLRAAKMILKESTMGYRLAGFLDNDYGCKYVEIYDKAFRVAKGISGFQRIASVLGVNTIMIALPDILEEQVVDLVNKIHMSSHKILFVPGIKGVALLNAEIIPPFMDSLLLVHLKNNLMYLRSKLFKRFIDILLSFIAIIVLAPIYLIIGISVKLTSEGPIIYKQKRLGHKGRVFYVYKFRTMYADAERILQNLLNSSESMKKEWENTHKLAKDPRITPLGKFLRRTSLDELPQFFNVLKGDMSLVGPRPVTQDEINRHYKEDADYYFMVRPGITGLWQVSGRSDTDYKFRVETDVWYVLNWSPWLDLMILAKTVWVVLRGKGAY